MPRGNYDRIAVNNRRAKPRIHPLLAKLREERITQRVAQTVLAERIGTDATSLGDWERGARQPGFALLLAWAQELGMKLVLTKGTSE